MLRRKALVRQPASRDGIRRTLFDAFTRNKLLRLDLFETSLDRDWIIFFEKKKASDIRGMATISRTKATNSRSNVLLIAC